MFASPAFFYFSQGLDIADVRYVYVLRAPEHVGDLFQQWGRGGRDGLPAEANLYWCKPDRMDKNGRGLEQKMKEFLSLKVCVPARSTFDFK